jgi:hypothetical protein
MDISGVERYADDIEFNSSHRFGQGSPIMITSLLEERDKPLLAGPSKCLDWYTLAEDRVEIVRRAEGELLPKD